jgi:hypothetical protein
MKWFAIASCAGLLMTGPLGAQEFSHFGFSVGAGFTQGVGATGSNLDLGWNVRAGAGVKFNPYVGLMMDGAYDNMGITSSRLATIGARLPWTRSFT